MLHIWHEDKYINDFNKHNSATQLFWEFLKSNNLNTELTNAEIRGFNSNSKLLEYIKNNRFNANDKYIIFIDKPLDNAKVMHIYREAKRLIGKNKNIYLSEIVSFEYMLLEFRQIHVWLKPTNKNEINNYNRIEYLRQRFIYCIKNVVEWSLDRDLVNFVIVEAKLNVNDIQFRQKLRNISQEKMAFYILHRYSVISGNFLFNKSCLDDCWTCDCCIRPRGYPEHNTNVPCNIFRYKKNSSTKAVNLWNNTAAKSIIQNHS